MTDWTFRLNAIGMTPLHKAGLVGLAANLFVLKEKGLLAKEIDFELSEQSLMLMGVEKNAEGLHRLLSMVYEIENGLINFPLIRDWRESQKAQLQQLLYATFLQHPQARRSEKINRTISEELDGEIVEYSYLPLIDLRHRYNAVCHEWETNLKKNKRIELKGWAYPGAMKRHESIGKSVLTDDPEIYPLLLCAPLGCLYYKGIAYTETGKYDPKTEAFLVVPRYNSLKQQAKKLEKFYADVNQETSALIAVSESDAALQAAYYLKLAFINQRLKTQLSVFRFGKVSWSKQRTRTGVFHSLSISDLAVKQYDRLLKKMVPISIKSSTGNVYSLVFPARGLMAENMVQERPWYCGFACYMADKRYIKVRIWSKELNEMIKEPEFWTDEKRRQFVLLVQDGIKNRYGKVSEQAKRSNADLGTAFKREYEKIRLAFAHCRTREQLRKEATDFFAKTRPKLEGADVDFEREIFMLVTDKRQDWQEIRDLCLLALAGYRGKGSKQIDDPSDVKDEVEPLEA